MPINRNSFSDNNSTFNTSQDTIANTSDKGFYVSFEDEQTPKRPKPPLRTKKIVSKASSFFGHFFKHNKMNLLSNIKLI